MRTYFDTVIIESVNEKGGGFCRLENKRRSIGFNKHVFKCPKVGQRYRVYVSEGHYVTLYDGTILEEKKNSIEVKSHD